MDWPQRRYTGQASGSDIDVEQGQRVAETGDRPIFAREPGDRDHGVWARPWRVSSAGMPDRSAEFFPQGGARG